MLERRRSWQVGGKLAVSWRRDKAKASVSEVK